MPRGAGRKAPRVTAGLFAWRASGATRPADMRLSPPRCSPSVPISPTTVYLPWMRRRDSTAVRRRFRRPRPRQPEKPGTQCPFRAPNRRCRLPFAHLRDCIRPRLEDASRRRPLASGREHSKGTTEGRGLLRVMMSGAQPVATGGQVNVCDNFLVGSGPLSTAVGLHGLVFRAPALNSAREPA